MKQTFWNYCTEQTKFYEIKHEYLCNRTKLLFDINRKFRFTRNSDSSQISSLSRRSSSSSVVSASSSVFTLEQLLQLQRSVHFMSREKHGHLFVSHLLYLQLHMTNSNTSSGADFFVVHLIWSLFSFLSQPFPLGSRGVLSETSASFHSATWKFDLFICSTRAPLVGGNRCGSGT